jgi:hypothetical protein
MYFTNTNENLPESGTPVYVDISPDLIYQKDRPIFTFIEHKQQTIEDHPANQPEMVWMYLVSDQKGNQISVQSMRTVPIITFNKKDVSDVNVWRYVSLIHSASVYD